MAHATGFHKLVWRPLVDALRQQGFGGRIVASDFRSHGQAPKLDQHTWTHFGDDVSRTLYGITGPIVGVGHSMGATALLQSALAHPDRFRGLVLVEPIVFPPVAFESAEHPLVVGAARRRREFGSQQEAIDNFAGKSVFANWVPDALAAYVEGGLVKEGDGWALACEPADEADIFRRAGSDDVFSRLEQVTTPTVLVVGETTDTYPAGYVEILGDRMASTDLVYIQNAGHFVPMERPAALARVVIEATAHFLR